MFSNRVAPLLLSVFLASTDTTVVIAFTGSAHFHAFAARGSGRVPLSRGSRVTARLFGGGGSSVFDSEEHNDEHQQPLRGAAGEGTGSTPSSKPQPQTEIPATAAEVEVVDDGQGGAFPTDYYLALEGAFTTSSSPSSSSGVTSSPAATEMSDTRRARLELESKTRERFAYGNDLSELRATMDLLRMRLQTARQEGDVAEAEKVGIELRRASLKDAEFVYGETLQFAERAAREGRREEEEMFRQEAAEVKKCIPQFNIEGLWVGKYGSHGYEMINVTYIGDTLVAYKVTGDKNVPRGEISFTADLSPTFHAGSDQALGPIQLTDAASRQWGTKELVRFPGSGQVAAEGYKNARWMEGQLIMVGQEYFSFAWVPIGHQIFFGRPSAELTLKMLQQQIEHDERSEEVAPVMEEQPRRQKREGNVVAMDNDVEAMRAHALRCFEISTAAESSVTMGIDDNDVFQ